MIYRADMNRRRFISLCTLGCAGLAVGTPLSDNNDIYTKEARFYDSLPYKKIRCTLCPRECDVDNMERGYCGVRENRGGKYNTLVYGRVCALHIDPIEKKPLFHFLPGTQALSLATAGCNVNCKFCQNWEISQVRPEDIPARHFSPLDITGIARSRDIPTIAYTYTEPVIFYEYMFDTASEGHAKNPPVRSVMISGGYINKEPLNTLLPVMDAVKIDLKAYTESFYRDYVCGELKPVLDTLVTLKTAGKWSEIVYLVIPTLNDGSGEIREMCQWIYAELGPDIPIHFSRFHPQYLIRNLPSTPVGTLERCRKIALDAGLHYVYIGNVPGHPAEHTYCPGCNKILIRRTGYYISELNIRNDRCSFCNQTIPGVWS